MPAEDILRAGRTVGSERLRALRGEELSPTTFTGKALFGAEQVLGSLANLASRGVFLPVAEKLAGDDILLQRRLSRLREKKRPVYLSDITTEMGLLQPEEGESFARAFPKGTGRFLIDVLGDPLTYLTFGAGTTLGKVAKSVAAAKRSEEPVKLVGKVAQKAAKLAGLEKPSAEAIRRVPKSLEGKPLGEQIKAGQRSLVSFDVPFTDINVPLVGGKVGAALAKPFTMVSRIGLAARLENSFRRLFSVHSGNPEFDKLASEFRDLGMARADAKIESGKVLNEKLENLSRSLGVTREQLNKVVTGLVEKETKGLPARAVGKVAQAIPRAGKKVESVVEGVPGLTEDDYHLAIDKGLDLNDELLADKLAKAKGGVTKNYEIFDPKDGKVVAQTVKEPIYKEGKVFNADDPGNPVEIGEDNLDYDVIHPALKMQTGFNPSRFTEDEATKARFSQINARYLSSGERSMLAGWMGTVDQPSLKSFLGSVEKNSVYQEQVQKALDDLDVPDPVPVYVGREEKFPSKTAAERPLSYGTLHPWTARMFAKSEGYVTRYLVPKKDVVGMALGMGEGEVFFRTGNVKSAERGGRVVAPLFATAKGQRSWLSPTAPLEVLNDALNWVDNNLLGVVQGEGKKDPTLRSYLIKLKAWLERTIEAKQKGLEAPEAPMKGPVVETPTQLQKLIEGDKYVPPPIKPQLGSFEITPAGSIKQTGAVHPEVQKIVDDLREAQQRQLLEEQVSGVPITPLLADREYIAHVTTPEARDAAVAVLKTKGEAPRGFTTREFSTRLANTLRRQFTEVKPEVVDKWVEEGIVTAKKANALKGKHGLEHMDELLENGAISDQQFSEAVHSLSIEEVHQLQREGKLKDIFGDYTGEIFHSDPVFSSSIRGVKGEISRTNYEFYQRLIDTGIAKAEGSPGTGSFVKVRQPELEGYVFEPEVANHLNNMYRFNTDDRELKTFLRIFDQTQDAWKAWTLAIFPAYHTRNFVGNMWNAFLAGVHNPNAFIMAGRLQMGGKVSFTDALGKHWNSQSLYESAKKLGVVDRGWVGAEIERTIQQRLSKGSWITPTGENKLVRFGFKIGRGVENNSRMALFIDRLMKGDTASEAAFTVKKYLFDYSELTNFERKVMKRLFPFYTWTRKNVPLQIQHLITKPAKFGIPYKVRVEGERNKPAPNLKYLPQWMVENFPNRIRYNPKTKKYEYFLLQSWLPAQDLAKLLEVHETMVNMLTPVPKEIIQQAFNYDFFMKKKIEEIPGAKEKFLGMDLPKRVTHGGKLIRLLNEIDKLTKDEGDLLHKISSVASGKVYTYDPEEARVFNKIRVDKEIGEMRSALGREARKKNPDKTELERIRTLIREKAKEY